VITNSLEQNFSSEGHSNLDIQEIPHIWQQSVHIKVTKSPESPRKRMRVHYNLNHYMEEDTNWLVLTVINSIISVVLAMTDNTDFLVSRRCSLDSHVTFF
jgi:hypothetical protein